ncbi:citrate synthase family protein [Saccharobesus litoralis]|nr:citrate/2-methylcitrate synthase [Saccharobesus litoralis]
MTSEKTKRDFVYAGKAQTSIFLEKPSDTNPYISQTNYLQGYNLKDLVAKKSFSETLLLMFTGELPNQSQAKLLERLMIALIDLGPRHPAVKASMVAGVSKTNAEHLLPIGLSVLGGEANGANEVAACVDFLTQSYQLPPKEVAAKLLEELEPKDIQGEVHICPGFGNQYGSIDEMAVSLVNAVFCDQQLNQSFKFYSWVKTFCLALAPANFSWLKTGLAATVFCELGIPARESIGLFQLLCAPGIFAHGVEQTHKPITAMPILKDEQHIYSPE